MSAVLPGAPGSLGGSHLARLPASRQRGPALALKRLVDLVGASVGLVVLAPAFAVVAALVRLDSRGPALYRAPRLGRDGRPFVALKFRSMHVDTDDTAHRDYVVGLLQDQVAHTAGAGTSGAGMYKLTDDDRVTRVGRWLRRTSLDELPQLVNVLRGEMSLVGPRPEVAYALEAYPDWAYERFTVLPGLTGLWQTSGRNQLSPLDIFRLDVEYARRWSPGLDLRLLLATPAALARKDSAA